jgi:hypothetical protein
MAATLIAGCWGFGCASFGFILFFYVLLANNTWPIECEGYDGDYSTSPYISKKTFVIVLTSFGFLACFLPLAIYACCKVRIRSRLNVCACGHLHHKDKLCGIESTRTWQEKIRGQDHIVYRSGTKPVKKVRKVLKTRAVQVDVPIPVEKTTLLVNDQSTVVIYDYSTFTKLK